MTTGGRIGAAFSTAHTLAWTTTAGHAGRERAVAFTRRATSEDRWCQRGDHEQRSEEAELAEEQHDG